MSPTEHHNGSQSSRQNGGGNTQPSIPNIIVMCGPSGSGKSTLTSRLTKEYPNSFGFSVSHTTRKPRHGEVDGVHYNFVDISEMKEAIAKCKFLEWAEFSNNLYGTSRMAVQKVLDEGRLCLLDIDLQGVLQIKKCKPFGVHYLFVQPPSLEILEDRLRKRNTEDEANIQKRLAIAREEMRPDVLANFDSIIKNGEIDEAYNDLKVALNPIISAHRDKSSASSRNGHSNGNSDCS